MRVWVDLPYRVRVDAGDREQALRDLLSFKDQKVEFEIRKFRQACWYADKHGREAYEEKMQDLKARRTRCVLFEDEFGSWTYSGLASRIATFLGCEVESEVQYPKLGTLQWAEAPEFERYPFQREAQGALLAARHAGVEIGTGLGKTMILTHLLQQSWGVGALVMVPSEVIARQVYGEFKARFGARNVGLFGAGKKESNRPVVVGIAASLTRVEPGSQHWKALSSKGVFAVDESHLCPAATLESVCTRLMGHAPYRYFFSGTQIRGDGQDLVLEGITGPIVYEYTVPQGIEKGYLSRLDFTLVHVESPSEWVIQDPNAMTRHHLFENMQVLKRVADLADQFADRGQQTLILLDEFSQFTKLYPLLRHSVRFAHGDITKANRAELPQAFHDSDPTDLVRQFNEGEFWILCGTSCLVTGTNVTANEATIFLRGGKSEVEVRQGACGRSTRLHTFANGRKKSACHVVDFDVVNVPVLHRHAQARKKVYEAIAPVQEVRF